MSICVVNKVMVVLLFELVMLIMGVLFNWVNSFMLLIILILVSCVNCICLIVGDNLGFKIKMLILLK